MDRVPYEAVLGRYLNIKTRFLLDNKHGDIQCFATLYRRRIIAENIHNNK